MEITNVALLFLILGVVINNAYRIGRLEGKLEQHIAGHYHITEVAERE